jgi:hypothetical protein
MMLLDLSTQKGAADYRRAQIAEEFRRVGAGPRHASRHRLGRTGLVTRFQRLLHRHQTVTADRMVRHGASPDPAR